jgi:hypothetical protein
MFLKQLTILRDIFLGHVLGLALGLGLCLYL